MGRPLFDPSNKKEAKGALTQPKEVAQALQAYNERKEKLLSELSPEEKKAFKPSTSPELIPLYEEYKQLRKEWLSKADPQGAMKPLTPGLDGKEKKIRKDGSSPTLYPAKLLDSKDAVPAASGSNVNQKDASEGRDLKEGLTQDVGSAVASNKRRPRGKKGSNSNPTSGEPSPSGSIDPKGNLPV
jgi:hypothetical protein